MSEKNLNEVYGLVHDSCYAGHGALSVPVFDKGSSFPLFFDIELPDGVLTLSDPAVSHEFDTYRLALDKDARYMGYLNSVPGDFEPETREFTGLDIASSVTAYTQFGNSVTPERIRSVRIVMENSPGTDIASKRAELAVASRVSGSDISKGDAGFDSADAIPMGMSERWGALAFETRASRDMGDIDAAVADIIGQADAGLEEPDF